MSIAEGRFKIGDMVIDKNTRISEFGDRKEFEIYVARKGRLAVAETESTEMIFLGITCSMELEFFDGRLKDLKLMPFIADAEHLPYPTEKDQKMKYDLIKSELRKHYGIPDQEDEQRLLYTFPGGKLSSDMILKGRDRYTGGCIYINFEG